MRIQRSDAEHLVVAHSPWICGSLALAPLVGLIYLSVSGELSRTQPVGTWQDDLFKIAVALAVVAPWTAIFLWMAKKNTFDFDLRARQLNWRRVSIFRRREGQIPFSDVRCAWVEPMIGSSSECTCSYRLSLSTTQGKFPLMDYFTGGKFSAREYERLAAAINAAIKANSAEGMEKERP